jgi:hypothetical protein
MPKPKKAQPVVGSLFLTCQFQNDFDAVFTAPIDSSESYEISVRFPQLHHPRGGDFCGARMVSPPFPRKICKQQAAIDLS